MSPKRSAEDAVARRSASRRAGCSRAPSRAPASRCGSRPPAATVSPTSRFSTRTWPNSSTSPSSVDAGELAALARDDDREVLAARAAPLDGRRDVVVDDRLLGDQDVVGAAGDARSSGAIQPACRPIVSTTMMRLCDSAVEWHPVDRLGGDVDGGVEAEGVVGAVQVVVDRLRDADDGQAVLGVELRGDAERVLAADRDERVELLEGLADAFDAALELVGVRPRGADDRAAAAAGSPRSRRTRAASGSPSIMPRQPFRTPTVSCPSSQRRRQTARMTAFSPGQSPPPVSIPIRIAARV